MTVHSVSFVPPGFPGAGHRWQNENCKQVILVSAQGVTCRGPESSP
jgi:hypothetical protein